MQIVRYTKEHQKEWNDFLKDSKNGTFLLNRNFMDYHEDRFQDHSVMVYDDKEKLVGIFPASMDGENKVVSHGGLTYGSLILDKHVKMPRILAGFKALLEYYHKNDIEEIVYKSIPSFYHILHSHEEQYLMFLTQAGCYRLDTSFTVDLQNEFKIQKRRKRSVKKGKKNKVEIECEADFETYWNEVLSPNLMKKFGTRPVHSLEEIQLLHERFPDKIKQYNAILDKDVVAGTTLFITRNTVHAQYISGTPEGRNSGALDLLFHYLITEEFEDYRYFSFGISNEEKGQKINKGLMDWKEGFGAKVFPNYFYKIKTANHTLLDDVYL